MHLRWSALTCAVIRSAEAIMNRVVWRSVGQVTRRNQLLALCAIVLASPPVLMGQSKDAVPLIPVSTLNHVSLSASYLQWTVLWYQKVFGLPIVYHQNSGPGGVYILRIGAGPSYLAISEKVPADRSHPWTKIDVASPMPGQPRDRVLETPVLPHFGWGVKNFDADRLMRALGEHHVFPARGAIRNGTAELTFEDGDGRSLQFSDERSCGGAGYLGDKCGSTKAVKLPDD